MAVYWNTNVNYLQIDSDWLIAFRQLAHKSGKNTNVDHLLSVYTDS